MSIPTGDEHPWYGPGMAAINVTARHAGGGYFSESSRSMVLGMATIKITVTLQYGQVEEIRALVASISGFVQHAVRVALYDAADGGTCWNKLCNRPAAP